MELEVWEVQLSAYYKERNYKYTVKYTVIIMNMSLSKTTIPSTHMNLIGEPMTSLSNPVNPGG